MASATFMFLAMTSSIYSGALAETLVRVECEPAVGVLGQTTKISCTFKSLYRDTTISIVSVSKSQSQEVPVFTFHDNTVTGDTRFKLPSTNNPSLELSNPSITDEGEYVYSIVTNHGIVKNEVFRISITAKYSQPTTNTWPEEIEDGGYADLYCNASGGYPAGVIHWFDSLNTDWTKSATLDIKEEENKLLKLSSKLTFNKIDSAWAPFRCVILNKKSIKEGESELQPKIIKKVGLADASKNELLNNKPLNTTIVAPVVVIGSLLVGLLLVIVLRGQCGRRSAYNSSDDPDVEQAMNQEKQNGEDTEVKT